MTLPITPRTKRSGQKLLMLRFYYSFEACKTTALQCRKRGDIEGARFWATQARTDWNRISEWLAA